MTCMPTTATAKNLLIKPNVCEHEWESDFVAIVCDMRLCMRASES